jgi:IS5 family transposase
MIDEPPACRRQSGLPAIFRRRLLELRVTDELIPIVGELAAALDHQISALQTFGYQSKDAHFEISPIDFLHFRSLFELMKLELPVPDHSTLSRRRRQLTITLPVKDWSKPRHLVVDSTGVKVSGEGEWKVRQHGVGKRRTWRKLHLCNDEATLEIVSVVASTNEVADAEALPDLLQDVPGEIEQVSADGAYDQRRCYDAPESPSGEGGHPAAQRREDLAARKQKAERQVRDENLRRIRKVGRKQWKRESSYHRRSLAADTGLPVQDDLRRPVANPAGRQSIQRAVTQERDLESDDTPWNA